MTFLCNKKFLNCLKDSIFRINFSGVTITGFTLQRDLLTYIIQRTLNPPVLHSVQTMSFNRCPSRILRRQGSKLSRWREICKNAKAKNTVKHLENPHHT